MLFVWSIADRHPIALVCALPCSSPFSTVATAIVTPMDNSKRARVEAMQPAFIKLGSKNLPSALERLALSFLDPHTFGQLPCVSKGVYEIVRDFFKAMVHLDLDQFSTTWIESAALL